MRRSRGWETEICSEKPRQLLDEFLLRLVDLSLAALDEEVDDLDRGLDNVGG